MIVPFLFFSSPSDWGIILVVVLLLFGVKRLPEMARGLGEGMKEFKKAIREVNEDEPAPLPAQPGTTAASAPNAVPTQPAAPTVPTPPPAASAAAAPRTDSPEDIENRIVH